MGHTSLNPDIYTNPHAFDPDRFSPERAEDKKGKYAYTGWGVGLHPCLGMKVGFSYEEMEDVFSVIPLFLMLHETNLSETGRLVCENGDEHAPGLLRYQVRLPAHRARWHIDDAGACD